MAFKDDISMQEYYGSFPTTSKATAVSRKAGVRKISVSPVLNAVGPTGPNNWGPDNIGQRTGGGEAEAMWRIPSPANPNRGPANIGPRTGDGTSIIDKLEGNLGSSEGNTGSGAITHGQPSGTGQVLKSNANLYVLGGAALLLALLVYRKLKK